MIITTCEIIMSIETLSPGKQKQVRLHVLRMPTVDIMNPVLLENFTGLKKKLKK